MNELQQNGWPPPVCKAVVDRQKEYFLSLPNSVSSVWKKLLTESNTNVRTKMPATRKHTQ